MQLASPRPVTRVAAPDRAAPSPPPYSTIVNSRNNASAWSTSDITQSM
jgi:hypothetical protein